MGGVGSSIAGHSKRLLIRYNAENRAHKFLDKSEKILSPRHPGSNVDVPLSREALEDIHCKNPNLDNYLKKVYLTSTSKIIGTPSKRPKPKKENEVFKKKMFWEPEKASPGRATLTNIIEILFNFQGDSDQWNANAIARDFNLDKKDVVNLIMYYSLFTMEKFDFINRGKEEGEPAPEKIEFEVYTQLEKKPQRQIDSK